MGVVRGGCCKVSEPLAIRAEQSVYPYQQFSTMAEARGPTAMDRSGWSYQGSSPLLVLLVLIPISVPSYRQEDLRFSVFSDGS